MLRWYLLFFLTALAGLFWLIASDMRSESQPVADRTESHPGNHENGFGQTDETYFDFHGDVNINDPASIRNRIEEIEQRLITMDGDSRQAIPFYGELVLLYQRLGRYDGSAEATRHIALISEDPADWWNAASLYYQWAEQLVEGESRQYFLERAEEAYSHAAEKKRNPELYADYSVVLVTLRRNGQALDILRESINILYRSGKKEESIPYIMRSVEVAASEEDLQTIHAAIASTSIEL
jgi:tetratricopeptide (TPR) repeat protein